MRVAVLTPSLPERAPLLAEAVASVCAQTIPPVAHLIGIDHERIGHVRILNQLATGSDAEWMARLDDDDVLDPEHLEALASGADDADIVYSWCRLKPILGPDGPPPEPSVLGEGGWTPNEEFDAATLRTRNFIPATTLVRRSLWEQLGGWNPSPPPGIWEDWEFWLRALDRRARFMCVPRITWTYRYHGANLWLS